MNNLKNIPNKIHIALVKKIKSCRLKVFKSLIDGMLQTTKASALCFFPLVH